MLEASVRKNARPSRIPYFRFSVYRLFYRNDSVQQAWSFNPADIPDLLRLLQSLSVYFLENAKLNAEETQQLELVAKLLKRLDDILTGKASEKRTRR